MEIIIVSIGAMAKNAMWGEKTTRRTSHATTTLIRTGDSNILVDPSLPPNILIPKLEERTGLAPDAITHIFLTNFRPIHRRAIEAFDRARWLLSEPEKTAAEDALRDAAERVERGAKELATLVRLEQGILKRIETAPDELAEDVDLFPLPGYSPGQSGLLIAQPTTTVVLAGDAVPSQAHFLAGRVFEDCFDVEQAKASLAEMYEVADLVIPGHDNLFVTPRQSGL